ncbi:unnamed protein product, partial [Ilex paraguariensis]
MSASLRLVDKVGADQNGGITAINHAVVEEQAEGGSGGGGVGDLLICDDFLHDLFKFWACFCVVVDEGEKTKMKAERLVNCGEEISLA